MEKLYFIVVFVGFSLVTSISYADDLYKWVDNKGSSHFTNNPNTIPAKYRDQVESRGMADLSQPKRQNKETKRKKPERTRTYSPSVRRKRPKYLVKASIRTKGNYLLLSGKISGGAECERAVVSVHVEDSEGGGFNMQDVVENIGGANTKLISAKRKLYSHNKYEKYEVFESRVRCLKK